MRLLDWTDPDDDTRGYWATFFPRSVKKEVMADAEARIISGDDADRILCEMPIAALDQAARDTGYKRLDEALNDRKFTAMLPLFVGDAEAVLRFRKRCVPRWMQLVHREAKGASWDVSRMHARRAMKTPLGTSSVDDIRLPKTSLHFRVQPESALASPDKEQHAPVTDVLVVEEPAPRRLWRIAVESGSAVGNTSALITSLDLPSGATLDTVLEQHAAQVATGEDWRSLLAWVVSMLLLSRT